MKRYVSKRRVKIRIAKGRASLEKMFQFEPKDDFTSYTINTHMAHIEDYWATAAFLRRIKL